MAIKVLAVAIPIALTVIAGMLAVLFLRPPIKEEPPVTPNITPNITPNVTPTPEGITPNVTPTPEGVIEIGRGRRAS